MRGALLKCSGRDWSRYGNGTGGKSYGSENATEDKAEAEDMRIMVRVVLWGSMVGAIGRVGCVRLRGVSEGKCGVELM